MRTISGWLPLLALSLAAAACSADHSPTAPPPATREPGATLPQTDILGVDGVPTIIAEGRDINDSGVVAGFAMDLSNGSRSGAVVWSSPDYRGEWLPTSQGMTYSDASHIANDGSVLGVECATAGESCVTTVWKDGVITHLASLDSATGICPCNGDVVVGMTLVDGLRRAAVTIEGLLLDAGVPDGFAESMFTAISMGHFVGNAWRSDGSSAAFRWSPSDGWVELPDGDGATVWDINAIGDAIGATSGGNAFWPGSGGSPTVDPVGTFVALNNSALVVGEVPIGFPNAEAGAPNGGGLWRLGTGWESDGLAFTEWVAVNANGNVVELVHANGSITTTVR